LVIIANIIAPLPPTTTNANQTFCAIDNPTIASLNAVGNNVLWYDTEISTLALDPTTALINGEDYWATQQDATSCESAVRLVVNATIIAPLPPTTSATNQTFCEIENPTIASLLITGTGILWYETETSTVAIDPTTALVNGEDYWATQNEGTGCESASRTVVNVTVITTLPPTTSMANQTFCVKDFEPTFPTIANLAVSGNGILWYATETSTVALDPTTALINGEDYWATQTENGCESKQRLLVNVTVINPPMASTTQSTQTFCASAMPTIANIQVTGDLVLWFASETSTTPLNSNEALINGGNYWALNTDAATGCESTSRLMVTTVIITVMPPVINNLTQTFCAADAPTVGNLQATGTVEWFASETSTSPLSNSTLLVNGNTYWAAGLNSVTGCISETKIAVLVALTDPGTPIITSQGEDFCVIDNPTLGDLDARVSANNGGTITWYNNYPNGNVLSLSQFLIDQETYYAVETNSTGCSSVTALEVTVDLNVCDQYDITVFDGFSPNGDGINDTFTVENLRVLYPDFTLEFFNRWGNSVYKATNNKPDWNGKLNNDQDYVPSGVYYYILHFNKNNRKPMQGSLYLSR
jgi:gliding motility-associated-like protein